MLKINMVDALFDQEYSSSAFTESTVADSNRYGDVSVVQDSPDVKPVNLSIQVESPDVM